MRDGHWATAFVLALAAAVLGGRDAQAAAPASYPSRPVTIVVSLAPGGVADIIGRAVAQRLQERWGTPFVVENKGGANTQVAAGQLAHAAPDGYSLLLTPEHTFTVNPWLYDKLSYDPRTDFVPVVGLVSAAQTLALNAAVPARSIAELVALAKAQPMTYASVGLGSTQHIGMELLQSMTGMELTPVQYRGAGPAVADVIAGHVPIIFVAAALVVEPWRAGKLTLLGVGSPKRHPALPDLPAIAETLPGFHASVSFSLFAPHDTPREIVDKLNGEIREIIADKDFAARFITPNYLEPSGGSPEELAQRIAQERELWGKLLKPGRG